MLVTVNIERDGAHALGVGQDRSCAPRVGRSRGHASDRLGMFMLVTISSSLRVP
jgi:hypothetical protein